MAAEPRSYPRMSGRFLRRSAARPEATRIVADAVRTRGIHLQLVVGPASARRRDSDSRWLSAPTASEISWRSLSHVHGGECARLGDHHARARGTIWPLVKQPVGHGAHTRTSSSSEHPSTQSAVSGSPYRRRSSAMSSVRADSMSRTLRSTTAHRQIRLLGRTPVAGCRESPVTRPR